MRRVLIPILLAVLSVAPASAEDDIWGAFNPLLGKWRGESEGFGSTARVKHDWEFVMKGAFLALHTDSRGEGPRGPEMHEDVGFLSFDRDAERWVFRQFLSEGFVNTFVVKPEEVDGLPAFDFEFLTAESAGSMRVRMRLVFTSQDAYTMTLDLAGKGGDYATCQTMHMKRFAGEE